MKVYVLFSVDSVFETSVVDVFATRELAESAKDTLEVSDYTVTDHPTASYFVSEYDILSSIIEVEFKYGKRKGI